MPVDSFPKVERTSWGYGKWALHRSVKDRPEYEGCEYKKHATERCEVIVYIGKSEEFPDIIEAWYVIATRFRFVDTYQVVARKALWYLCQIYEEPIARTPIRFFPPLEKDRWVKALVWFW